MSSFATAFTTAFVGAGNMAASIIGGMLAAGFPADTLRASATSETTLEPLRKLELAALDTDNARIVRGADVVVLAVKPQKLRAVCEELAPSITAEQLVLSVAAGVTSDSLSGWLGGHAAIVRCMPNTPSLLGVGASGVYARPAVSGVQRQRTDAILSSVGVVRWLDDEQLLHAVTAIAGSAPAYFFQFMQAMIAEGERMGLDAPTARTLCAQTCLGAGTMLAESDEDAATLLAAVCSPGGTTERAVEAFTAGGLEALVAAAMQRCHARSQEMAEEFS